jgi:predicted transcriptional regulator
LEKKERFVMNSEEIMEMARQAGCPDVYTEWAKSDWASIKGLIVPMTLEQLVHCAKLVAAKEREACAKVCDALHKDWKWRAAESIRARGEQA